MEPKVSMKIITKKIEYFQKKYSESFRKQWLANTKLGFAAQGRSRVFPREDFQKNGSNFF